MEENSTASKIFTTLTGAVSGGTAAAATTGDGLTASIVAIVTLVTQLLCSLFIKKKNG